MLIVENTWSQCAGECRCPVSVAIQIRNVTRNTCFPLTNFKIEEKKPRKWQPSVGPYSIHQRVYTCWNYTNRNGASQPTVPVRPSQLYQCVPANCTSASQPTVPMRPSIILSHNIIRETTSWTRDTTSRTRDTTSCTSSHSHFVVSNVRYLVLRHILF